MSESQSQSQPEPSPFSDRPIYSDLYPLDEFYAAHGLTLPVIGRIEAREVPAPHQSLLVHPRDMTSTLEKFHKHRIHIHVTASHANENEYFREVVLELDRLHQPVEFGAIKINLDLFPHGARQEILREQRPLGRILAQFSIAVNSRPRAFLRVASDDYINKALKLQGICFLYGRRNCLLDNWGRPLAEIVEILPP
jgi:chorismate-pyruvate lyase